MQIGLEGQTGTSAAHDTRSDMSRVRLAGALAICIAGVIGVNNPALAGGLSLALSGGGSISNESFKYFEGTQADRDWHTGPALTVHAGLPITRGFVVLPEVAYVQKGSERAYEYTDPFGAVVHFRETFRVEYMSIRLVARKYLLPGVSGVFAEAGVRGDIRLGSEWDVQSTEQGTLQSPDPYSDGLQGVVFGGLVGLGYNVVLVPKLSLVTDARFDVDFTNAWEPTDFPLKVGTAEQMKHRSVQLSIGMAVEL